MVAPRLGVSVAAHPAVLATQLLQIIIPASLGGLVEWAGGNRLERQWSAAAMHRCTWAVSHSIERTQLNHNHCSPAALASLQAARACRLARIHRCATGTAAQAYQCGPRPRASPTNKPITASHSFEESLAHMKADAGAGATAAAAHSGSGLARLPPPPPPTCACRPVSLGRKIGGSRDSLRSHGDRASVGAT